MNHFQKMHCIFFRSVRFAYREKTEYFSKGPFTPNVNANANANAMLCYAMPCYAMLCYDKCANMLVILISLKSIESLQIGGATHFPATALLPPANGAR